MEKQITEAPAHQRLEYNEKNELIAITACGIVNGDTNKDNVYFNEELGFFVSNETAQKLLAERNERTFLPVSTFMNVVSSNPDVAKISEELKNAIENYKEKCKKIIDSKEKHVQISEKRITELEEENKNIKEACERANKKYVELEKDKQECEEKLNNSLKDNDKQFHMINELTNHNSELWSAIASYNSLPFWKRLFMKVKSNFDFVFDFGKE